MPYINFNNAYPGIRAALAFRPQVAEPLAALTDILLRETSGLSRAEREIIGMHVSALNQCEYCYRSHAAVASAYLDNNDALIREIQTDFHKAAISDKLKSLISIAGKVQENGKLVQPGDIEEAKRRGASDMEIHDTVLIAALFSLFNRYVDGLVTTTPDDDESYKLRACQVVKDGYGGVAKSPGG